MARVGTRTPVLAHDGADLAAALQTIWELGATGALDRAIGEAFPGSTVAIADHDGLFSVTLRQPGVTMCALSLRPQSAATAQLVLVSQNSGDLAGTFALDVSCSDDAVLAVGAGGGTTTQAGVTPQASFSVTALLSVVGR